MQKKSLINILRPHLKYILKMKKIRIINLEQKHGIKIKLSQKYLSLLNHPDTDEETNYFKKEKYKKAKELDDNYETDTKRYKISYNLYLKNKLNF